MLPTFVIGLREGLEAALIVGIIAAFLRKQGRRDLLRWVLGGVGFAVVLCVAAGIALHVASEDLPQKQQEGLETVIAAVAVGMVTYMVIWMRRNSRNLKGQLEGLAAEAMHGTGGAGRAMVLMAFLAVIREGLETVVFVIAAFNEASNGTTAGFGLLLGILLAVLLGYGIYRGGVRINLSKFFRATGVVLVLVAAGLVVNAVHTAHEAGWLNAGQGRTVDLSWLVSPGSVQSSLLTGMLGLQPFPVTIEVIGWLVYLVPVGLYVAWPPGRAVPLRATAVTGAIAGGLAGVAALLCTLLAPSSPAQRPTLSADTSVGSVTAVVGSRAGTAATVRASAIDPVTGTTGAPRTYRLTSQGLVEHAGSTLERFAAEPVITGVSGRPATVTQAQAAALNGGRLPIGVPANTPTLDVTYTARTVLTVYLDTRTDRVVDASWRGTVLATLRAGARVYPLDTPVQTRSVALPAGAVAGAVRAATSDHADLDRRSSLRTLAAWLLALTVVGLLAATVSVALLRRRRTTTGVTRDARPFAVSKA